MQAGNLIEESVAVMTPESVAGYVRYEQERGVSESVRSRYKRSAASLYEWLPEDKKITRVRLLDWRNYLRGLGYSTETERSYIKGINRYLDYLGCSDLRFKRGKEIELAGKQFGYLTVVERTGKKDGNILWRCRCKCGREGEFQATHLLTGKTMSCGCLRREYLEKANQYYDGTSLRQSLEEHVFSSRTPSGYTGVVQKRGKWNAYIKYKGRRISLGCYTNLEDAVKARARGKELVIRDAMGLLDFYEELHREDVMPNRMQIRQQAEQSKQRYEPVRPKLLRRDNTSGCPGVSRKRKKWQARVTYQKNTYHLGLFDSLEEAVSARREAEEMLDRNPEHFIQWINERMSSNQI